MGIAIKCIVLVALVGAHLVFLHPVVESPYHGTGPIWGAVFVLVTGLIGATLCHIGASIYAARNSFWAKRTRTALIIAGLLSLALLVHLADFDGDGIASLAVVQLVHTGLVGALLFGPRKP